MLHITNGESVIQSFREMELPGEYLSWMDVLVEGPVPQCDSLEALSTIRATFIGGCGWESPERAATQFADRDHILRDSRNQDEVILWFEHDLHDHLQLLQVLHWYHTNPPLPTRLTLLQPKVYLGSLPPDVLQQLIPFRQEVRPKQFDLAQRAWDAFVAPDPSGLAALLALPDADLNPLPYLRGNTLRLLAEYPSVTNGLSRTGQFILEAIADGKSARHDIYAAFSAKEDPVFLGDWSIWRRLDRLAEGGAITSEPHEITAFGRSLLASEADWIRARGIDRWIGGVHLEGVDARWRWDNENERLVAAQ